MHTVARNGILRHYKFPEVIKIPNAIYDFMLITMKRPIKMNQENAIPARLPTFEMNDNFLIGKTLFASGWGNTIPRHNDEDNKVSPALEFPDGLRVVQLKYVSNSVCKSIKIGKKIIKARREEMLTNITDVNITSDPLYKKELQVLTNMMNDINVDRSWLCAASFEQGKPGGTCSGDSGGN